MAQVLARERTPQRLKGQSFGQSFGPVIGSVILNDCNRSIMIENCWRIIDPSCLEMSAGRTAKVNGSLVTPQQRAYVRWRGDRLHGVLPPTPPARTTAAASSQQQGGRDLLPPPPSPMTVSEQITVRLRPPPAPPFSARVRACVRV